MMRRIFIFIMVIFASCGWGENETQPGQGDSSIQRQDSFPAKVDSIAHVKVLPLPPEEREINTLNVRPDDVVSFAKTLQGVRYKFGSTEPATGFDCSGFITYVFNHFKIRVPRSSDDFTNVGRQVPAKLAKPGDLILFTGTDSTVRIVGHMGIVTKNDESGFDFIHATSGKAYGVTITTLNKYYRTRFVKVIRIFPERQFKAQQSSGEPPKLKTR